MSNFNLEKIRNKFYELNSSRIFILSFFICISFYFVEGFFGVDRFYHPDSSHYLTKYYYFNLQTYLSNPLKIFDGTYYHITNLFKDNYYLLILLNFILYSLTNVFIYQKVFKKYFHSLNNFKLILLFYLLFLDPYRLHLASHVLKETFLIFFIIVIILSNIKIVKIFSLIALEGLRSNSWIYILIFLTYSNIKKFFKSRSIYIICVTLILLIYFSLLEQNLNYLLQSEYEKLIKLLKIYYDKTMPIRSYDNISQFKDFGFPLGFILKNITWPLMLVSGFFFFFVSSFLFKFLGLVIILNNIVIYIITKKTFISFGLIIILLMISVYTASYTSMFRYSYIALYSSIIYFFFKLRN